MSDPVTDIVSVEISIDSVGPSQAGFGIAAILTHDAPWADRVRYYSSTGDASDDGFTSGHPVYLALTRAFAQSPKPESVAVLRTSTDVTQAYALAVSSVRDSTAYTINVKGQAFDDAVATFTSGIGTTNDLIADGLVAALNAVTGRGFTAESVGAGGSHTISIIADEALVVPDFTFTAATTDIVTAVANDLATGDGPLRATNSGGALPAGLATLTDYYWIRIDADTGKLAASRALALAGTAVDITGTGTGTHTLSDTAATRTLLANSWFSVESTNRTLISNSQTHAAPSGLSADLDTILQSDDGWFGVVSLFNSPAYILALSTWVESNQRIYFADSLDSGAETVVVADGTDGLAQLNAATPKATLPIYHPRANEMIAIASLAKWLADEPGESVIHLKNLVGVTASGLSGTGRTNVKNRHAAFYVAAGGLNVLIDNGVPNRTYQYIDVTRNLYWLVDLVQSGVYAMLAGAKILPYTREGIQRVGAKVLSLLLASAVPQGVLAGGADAPIVTTPKIEDVPDADKSSRTLNNVKFSGVLQGAIYKVNVTGAVVF